MAFQKIPGAPLCGFADLFQQPRAIGATKLPTSRKPPPPAPPAQKGNAPKAGTQGTSSQKIAAGPHMKSLASATSAAQKAISAGKKAAKSAASYKPTQHMPLVPVAKVTVHGEVMLGLLPPKTLTPAQANAVNKHARAIAKHAQATKRLNIAAAQASKIGNTTAAFVKTTAPAVTKALSVKTPWPTKSTGPTRVHGIYGSYLIGTDAAGFNPGDPGYDPTTDPSSPQYIDPNAAGSGAGGLDTSSGIVTDPNGNVLYDPSQDPAVVPMPQRGGSLSQSDAAVQWQHVPDDGIAYDGSSGFPDQSAGSYNRYFPSPNGNNDGFEVHSDGWFFKIGGDWHAASDAERNSGSEMSHASNGHGWGPMIGNPNGPLANLQYAASDGKWFWQSQNTPAQYTTEIDSKLAAANQKTIQANQAAAVAQAAQMAKDQAAQQEAQAKQDADNALKQQAADAAQQVAQTQADTADVTAQQQLSVQQQQADIQAQTLQQQDAVKQAEFERQMAMMQAQQAPAPQYGGGYGGGGGGGNFDDGSDGGGEADSQAEADAIDDGSGDDTMSGSLYRRGDYGVGGGAELVGGDGSIIGIDEYGNVEE